MDNMSNSQQAKKPIYINLQKSGNGFTFAKPASKIPKLCVPTASLATLRLVKSIGPVNQGLKTQNQIDSINTYPLINEAAVTAKNVSDKFINHNRNPGPSFAAPASIAIPKQKLVKKTYKRKQPNMSPSTTKFYFPPPPPKIDFKVLTSTQFMTAIDDTREYEPKTSMAVLNGTSTGVSNGAPSNCKLFTKLKIDTGKSINSKISNRHDLINSKVKDSASLRTIHKLSNVELQESTENVEKDDFTSHSQTSPVVEPFTEFAAGSATELVTEPATELFTEAATEPGTEQHDEIIKRLDRMEALQLASAKRDSQILVAVKKLCLAYTKYNDDNDEIKKLLPVESPIQFDALDTQLIEDPVFAEKFRAYLRGFRTATSPENFTSMLSVVMTDGLVDKYNFKGILGKNKLQGYKIIEIIQDLHKPMDAKIFDRRMRTTIELAKNRFHNEQYRKRQLGIKQQNETNSRK